MVDEYPASEWTPDQWLSAWTINVGKVYVCGECGKMIIVTKGGVGLRSGRCRWVASTFVRYAAQR